MICLWRWWPAVLVVVVSINNGFGQSAEQKAALLYQGRIYQRHPVGIEGNPGFKDLAFVNGGTVLYDSIRYRDLVLFYDIVKDELVALHPDGVTSIILVKPFVQEFTMSGDTLINVLRRQAELEPGYYQRLLSTTSGTCLVKRHKKINHFTSSTERRSSFLEANRYFVRVGNGSLFYEVKSQSALLRHFKSRRKQLRDLLFGRGVRFREQPEEAIRLVFNYMAQISIP